MYNNINKYLPEEGELMVLEELIKTMENDKNNDNVDIMRF